MACAHSKCSLRLKAYVFTDPVCSCLAPLRALPLGLWDVLGFPASGTGAHPIRLPSPASHFKKRFVTLIRRNRPLIRRGVSNWVSSLICRMTN